MLVPGCAGKVFDRMERYVPHIERFLALHPNASIFVATDSPAFLSWLRNRYPAQLVARSALRSERNAFLDSSLTDAYRKGEDVLIGQPRPRHCPHVEAHAHCTCSTRLLSAFASRRRAAAVALRVPAQVLFGRGRICHLLQP